MRVFSNRITCKCSYSNLQFIALQYFIIYTFWIYYLGLRLRFILLYPVSNKSSKYIIVCKISFYKAHGVVKVGPLYISPFYA